jgi:hypothetical protein
LLLLLSAQDLAACTLLFATVAVTASGQFLSFDYIGPMSGTLGEASALPSGQERYSGILAIEEVRRDASPTCLKPRLSLCMFRYQGPPTTFPR